jgi:hypothetical protein
MSLFSFIGNGLDSISGANRNPADKAMPYLNQVPQVGQQYYNPYVQQGQQASQNVNQQYQQLTQDPQSFLNQIMAGYKPSTGYSQQSDEALRAANNSAAAAGNLGTSYDQQNRAKLVQSLMGNDMQQYLQNVLGIYGTGLQGQQNTANQGYNASGQLADYLGNNLGAQAGLAYQGDAFKTQQRGNFLNSLISGASRAAGAGVFGGGAAGAVGK